MVVGRHQFKSYKGTIKITNPAGDAWVEVDALQQKLVQLTLSDLALLCVIAIFAASIYLLIKCRGEDEEHIHVFDPATQVKKTVRVAPEPELVLPQATCSTPLHQEVQTDVPSPAWDPNSSTPLHEQDQTDFTLACRSPEHWLQKLVGVRVKLFENSAPTRILEFEEIVGDKAKVRDGTSKRLIALEHIRPLRPTESEDLVTPEVGETSGTTLKVRNYGSEMCTLRIPGKPLRKSEKELVLPTETLVQIFPPFRR